MKHPSDNDPVNPMVNSHPSAQKLLQLLKDEFELPEHVTEFTIRASVDALIEINVTYMPSDSMVRHGERNER